MNNPIEDKDAALIFKENGSVELAMPIMEGEELVPSHVINAVAVLETMQSDEFKALFNAAIKKLLEEQVEESTTDNAE